MNDRIAVLIISGSMIMVMCFSIGVFVQDNSNWGYRNMYDHIDSIKVDYTCTNCRWVGYPYEMQVDEYDGTRWLYCPNCGYIIGWQFPTDPWPVNNTAGGYADMSSAVATRNRSGLVTTCLVIGDVRLENYRP